MDNLKSRGPTTTLLGLVDSSSKEASTNAPIYRKATILEDALLPQYHHQHGHRNSRNRVDSSFRSLRLSSWAGSSIQQQFPLRYRLHTSYRRFRKELYNFLERPSNALALTYHLAIFSYIIFVHCLSAVVETGEKRPTEVARPSATAAISHQVESSMIGIQLVVRYMELSLAVYFSAEFALRLWAVGADGKYQGWRGRLAYLQRPVCLIDVVVLSATAIVVVGQLVEIAFAPSTPNDPNHHQWVGATMGTGSGMEKLRFLQILRLFHIDRQMATWRLIEKMVRRSWYELLSAYYITFMVFMLLAVLVYTIENELMAGPADNSSTSRIEVANFSHSEPEANASALQLIMASSSDGNGDSKKTTFHNFGEAFWYSIVTITTIGYGDIVPQRWQSKLVVGFLSYLGLSMFATASGLLGVGMSLMVHDHHKRQRRGKLRQLAAKLIQTWYRFRLISDARRFGSIPHYRHWCIRLQLVERRIRRARWAAAKKVEERRQRSNTITSMRLTRVLLKRQADSGVILPNGVGGVEIQTRPSTTEPILDAVSTITFHPQLDSSTSHIASAESASPVVPLRMHSSSILSEESQGDGEDEASLAAQITTITSISSDEQCLEGTQKTASSPVDSLPQRSHANSQQSNDSRQTVTSKCYRSANVHEVEESRFGHYRAMLRLVYFFLFITQRRKFHRARKPFELKDVEAELCEMEHQRMQKFRALEARLARQLGWRRSGGEEVERWSSGEGNPEERSTSASQQNIHERLDACESVLSSVESKLEYMHELMVGILEGLPSQPQQYEGMDEAYTPSHSKETPPLRDFSCSVVLPPLPPSPACSPRSTALQRSVRQRAYTYQLPRREEA